MPKLSKVEFNRAIEDSDGTIKQSVPVSRVRRSQQTKRVIVTALLVALGITVGWVGGKVVNGRMNDSAAPTTVEGAIVDSAAASPTTPSDHPTKRAGTTGKEAGQAQPASDSQEPDAEASTESRAKEVEPREAPPKVPSVEKDAESDKPTADDPSKEIGRDALKKMSNETRKKRSAANKNEEDEQL